MNNYLIDISLSCFNQLGVEDDHPKYWIMTLYGIPCIAISLAYINAIISVFIFSDRGARWSKAIMANFYVIFFYSLIIQIFMGLAPIILCLKGIFNGYDFSVFVYGMPIVRLWTIIFCVIYQIKIIKEYDRKIVILLTKH